MTKREEKWALVRTTVGSGRLSVVMPVYNLADAIAANLAETGELFAAHGVRTELVPVDDGSTDGTAEVLRGFSGRTFGGDCVVVRPVLCARNGGKGAALRAGFEASTGPRNIS